MLTCVITKVSIGGETGDVITLNHRGVPSAAVGAVVNDVVHGGGGHILYRHPTLKTQSRTHYILNGKLAIEWPRLDGCFNAIRNAMGIRSHYQP